MCFQEEEEENSFQFFSENFSSFGFSRQSTTPIHSVDGWRTCGYVCGWYCKPEYVCIDAKASACLA